MQFSKHLLAFVLSIVLVGATEHSSHSTDKETSKHHDALRTTKKYEDYRYGYEDGEHYKTKTTHETTKTHYEHDKAMHTDSSHSMHKNKSHHNLTSLNEDHLKHMKTYTATSTAMTSASDIYESSTTAVYSEESYMTADTTMMDSTTTIYSAPPYMTADTTMTDSIAAVYSEAPYMATASTEVYSDVFTLSSCTDCTMDTTMTEAFGTELITASVSAQDFTMTPPASYVANTAMTTPPYNTQPSYMTTLASASMYAPSAGFATTSLAVFTGSGRRQSVDYLFVTVLPALVGMFIWI